MHALKVMYYIVFGFVVGAGVALLISMIGCSHHRDQDVSQVSLADVQAERDRRVAVFDESQVERCDRITFVALMDAYGKEMDIGRYEDPKGKWNRDVLPCFPEESRSECSLDGYLSVLHTLVGRPDRTGDILTYLQEKKWLCGSGDEGATNVWPLRLILSQMAGARLAEDEDALPNVLSGFRGHLLANYIWLHKRVNGRLPIGGQKILERLSKETPESPYLKALAGYSAESIGLLQTFKDCSRFWGSCNDDVYYAMTVAVLEGR